MNAGNEDSGDALYAAYLDEEEQYSTALQWAGELVIACRTGESIEERLFRLLELLAALGQKEARLIPVKQQWEQAGGQMNEAVRSVMNRIAVLIQQIQQELQALTQAMKERRDRLAIELDACNQGCRMQRAYQRKS